VTPVYTVEINAHGPLFDGAWQPAMDEFITEAVQEVGQQALSLWHHNLDGSLQHPTGYYESQLISELVAADVDIVSDRGIIYGPWLEGTGSRNSTTRFKGYAAQRRAATELEGQLDRVLAPVVARLTRRLNGA
jgi:hypothetical protein